MPSLMATGQDTNGERQESRNSNSKGWMYCCCFCCRYYHPCTVLSLDIPWSLLCRCRDVMGPMILLCRGLGTTYHMYGAPAAPETRVGNTGIYEFWLGLWLVYVGHLCPVGRDPRLVVVVGEPHQLSSVGPSHRYIRMICWGSLVSQDTLLYLMASSCPNQADQGWRCQFSMTPSYYSTFVIKVDECFCCSTYCKNVPRQCLNILSLI